LSCLVLWAAPNAFGQHLSFGIKAGVPITDMVQTNAIIPDQPFQAETKRYTVGPVVDIGLPLGLGIEVGAMYKHFGQQTQQFTFGPGGTTIGDTFYPNVTFFPVSAAGSSWEFPIAGQYHISLPLLRPYVEAGFSYNHLTNVYFPNQPQPGTLPTLLPDGSRLFPAHGKPENRGGFLLGVGFELKLKRIHLTPGLRYTRYNQAEPWLPSANALDFLLGFRLFATAEGKGGGAR
jgi:TonB dependent receptor